MRKRDVVFVGLFVLAAGCDRGAARGADTGSERDTLQVLIARLQTTSGRYVPVANRQYELEGKDSLLRPFAPFADSAVARLVGCLDRTDSTLITVEGRRALLGALCYEALTFVAYAEPEGSESGDWPGTVFPTANAAQLRAAKVAWQAVVLNRGYRLN